MMDLPALLSECAPNVAFNTMHAIISVESRFNPLALNVNGNVRLQRAPATVAEATAWASWLIARGYSVDLGLMQINSRNLARLNLTPAAAFDVCQNVRAGAAILTAEYRRAARSHGTGSTSLLYAISSYNTGNFRSGFRNGYVAKVMRAADARPLATLDLAKLVARAPTPPARTDRSIQPHAADSVVDGFGVAPAWAWKPDL